MKKYVPLLVGLVVIILSAGGYFIIRKPSANTQPPDLVETPPTVSKVNTLPMAQRPYVALIPHSNNDSSIGCNGVDLLVENLKNGENMAEYELEYTTTKLIQGVFGRRDFSDPKATHKPLEFGTCSKGRCKCDADVTGGSLKLTFTGGQEYVLKGDFTQQNVGEKQGKLTSRDVRLTIDVNGALPNTADIIITNTFGLPKDLTDKVILGPYGIFAEKTDVLKKPMKVTLQSQEAAQGKVQFYDGKEWNVMEATVDGDKATFELSQMGVVVLTE